MRKLPPVLGAQAVATQTLHYHRRFFSTQVHTLFICRFVYHCDARSKRRQPASLSAGGDSGGGVSTFAGPAREFIHTVSDPPRPEVLCAVSPASLPPSVSAPRPADNCQVEGCAEVVLRIGGMSRGVLCASHLRDGMQRVVHNDRIYGTHW